MTTPIFEVETALEAVLYVAERLKSKDFHKVLFADREHFAKYGRPITTDARGKIVCSIQNRNAVFLFEASCIPTFLW
jgi:hypothetical protein